MVRIKCSNCESTRGISYLHLDDESPDQKHAVAVEVCEECKTYLKICNMERDPLIEPVADDLASLPLDLLVAGTGKSSSGINYLLIHGEAESA
jgi:FdhE protein